MADEVKLITFAGETVSPLYDGLMQELYTGGGGIITGAVVTIKDASTLHITGGYGALCGREFEIFASDIPVTLSSSGTLKGRLYLHMDLAQSGAPIELLVEVASSLTPVIQDSDVNTTNGVYEVNLATFDVGTSAISNLVDVSPKLSKIPDQISSLNSALTDLKTTTHYTYYNVGNSVMAIHRCGNLRTLTFFNVPVSAITSQTLLEIDRPSYYVDTIIGIRSGYLTLMRVLNSGTISINSYNAYGGSEANMITPPANIMGSVTYIAG